MEQSLMNDFSNPDRLWSVKDLAEIRSGGVKIAAVRFWLSTKKLKGVKVGGRTMIRESDFREFMARSAATSKQRGFTGKRPIQQKKKAKPRRRGVQ